MKIVNSASVIHVIYFRVIHYTSLFIIFKHCNNDNHLSLKRGCDENFTRKGKGFNNESARATVAWQEKVFFHRQQMNPSLLTHCWFGNILKAIAKHFNSTYKIRTIYNNFIIKISLKCSNEVG